MFLWNTGLDLTYGQHLEKKNVSNHYMSMSNGICYLQIVKYH